MMETKRVTEDFKDRGETQWTPITVSDKMGVIETLFEECDEILTDAEMLPTCYESQLTKITTMTENMQTLQIYVAGANDQAVVELDEPLHDDFMNGATKTLSEIILSDLTTENTFNLEEHCQMVTESGEYTYKQVKSELTMEDFLGMVDIKPGEGMPTLDNVETLGIFVTAFRQDYAGSGYSDAEIEQIMNSYMQLGEYEHIEHDPVKEFVSGVLDVTIVKPLIESILGKDLITGEKLSDFERVMQFVNAALGVMTLGNAVCATKVANLIGKEAFGEIVKTWAVDVATDTAGYTTGYVCREMGLPVEIQLLASMLTGNTVSVKAGKYVFLDSADHIVMECTADEVEQLVKKGGFLSTFADTMTPEGAKKGLNYLENVSTAGLTKEKLEAIKEADEALALKKVNYQNTLNVQNTGKMGKGGSQPVPVENKNITGMDWYDYFRETYGKENVCWENCNPSEVATAWQGSYPYVGVDTYTNTTLYDGDII